ncbi:condensation domain-containing protein, partial [Nocardia amamiensis]|uniref:condensation domain-containing protein n=1 Tax=Nocardia amamiensis TaxID=404578 RepID=UPI000AE85FA8
RIVIDDLERAYQAATAGHAVVIEPEPTSFARWARSLHESVDSAQQHAERAHWDTVTQHAPFVISAGSGTARVDDAAEVVVAVEIDRIANLVRTRSIEPALAAALALALQRWRPQPASGTPHLNSVLVDVEGHGRDVSAGMDLSRSVGWFTAIYPVRLDLTADTTPVEALAIAREAIASTPRGGVGFGVGAYLAGWRLPTKTSDVCLNYLGHFATGQQNTVFTYATEQLAAQSADGARPYSLEVNAAIENGRLTVYLRYDTTTHNESDITAVAEATLTTLIALARQQ